MTPRLADTPVLETERLILRAPGAGDFDSFRAFMFSDRSRFVRSDEADEAKVWRAFGHIIGHWVLRGFGSFVFQKRDDDRPLGLCGPWYPATWPECEIGWAVWDAAAEGDGFAFEAATASRDHAFRDLGWETAVSYIDPVNDRSIRLAERLGATRDGKATPNEAGIVVYRHPRPDQSS